ncbi:MAG TPA: hypothetical protein VKB63_07975 [Gemmatimonadales bacterium]|nr:hypothetical protein [Gemmatimonadales bacterium]
MNPGRGWLDDLYASGVTPASFLPDASLGRQHDPDDTTVPGAAEVEMVEGADLEAHPVAPRAAPAAVSFLDGVQQWKVIGYDGVQPIALAYVAAAVRRRGFDRRLVTAACASRTLVIAPAQALAEQRRGVLEAAGLEAMPVEVDSATQPAQALEALRREVHRARAGLERKLGEQAAQALDREAWLVVDGQLAVSATLAKHPRAVGVIKSHGAQFLSGRHLERALTIATEHRTSVFRVRGGHGRTEVDSWYLRLWPWEGRDLHYGLIRVEAARDPDPGIRAPGISSWLLAERAPLAAPDTRFDRLLYPIHDVEAYLRSRAPHDLLAPLASRLPQTGT